MLYLISISAVSVCTHAHDDSLVHVGVVHELAVSLAVGGVQGPVLHQEVHQARGRGAQQVAARKIRKN